MINDIADIIVKDINNKFQADKQYLLYSRSTHC